MSLRKIKRRVDSAIPLDPPGTFSITLRPSSYEKVLNVLDLNESSRVLEIGCGKGHALYYCSLIYNVEYILGIDFPEVIDFSKNVLNIYQKKYPDEKLNNIDLKALDFMNLQSIENFTHIICIIESKEVFEHLLNIVPSGIKIVTVTKVKNAVTKYNNAVTKIPVDIENGRRTVSFFSS